MIIAKLKKSDSIFNIRYLDEIYYIFYYKSILGTPKSGVSWYYVLFDMYKFPISPRDLSHRSVLTIDNSMKIIKNALDTDVFNHILPKIKDDFLIRSIHES